MKIDVLTPIKDLKGEPFTSRAGDHETFVTLRNILTETLLAEDESDARAPAKDKVRRITLALRVDAEDEMDLSAEDITFLTGRVDKMCPAITVYRVREILDPASFNV